MMASDVWLEARFTEIRPKALAALTRQFRDVDLAEEAFSLSCLKAMQTWPENGLPDDPFAWLLAVARNAGIDLVRRRSRERAYFENAAASQTTETVTGEPDPSELRDDVLRLLFICCHPDLTARDQSALALKVVVGLDVSAIARAFLVNHNAMEQRLTRARRVIAGADVHFETPALAERHARLKTVSLMLYLMFNEGWSASADQAQIVEPLCAESIRLARLLLNLFAGVSEQMGLLALFLLHQSRWRARVNAGGDLVSLDEQDRSLWDREMINEGRVLLEKALRHRAPGHYQIKAAIAAVHAVASDAATTDWEEIERLYVALYQFEPTPVVKLNHAVAAAKVLGAARALAMLSDIETALASYRWFHTTRAALLTELGDFCAARVAYKRALLLGPTQPERRFIGKKIAECEKNL